MKEDIGIDEIIEQLAEENLELIAHDLSHIAETKGLDDPKALVKWARLSLKSVDSSMTSKSKNEEEIREIIEHGDLSFLAEKFEKAGLLPEKVLESFRLGIALDDGMAKIAELLTGEDKKLIANDVSDVYFEFLAIEGTKEDAEAKVAGTVFKSLYSTLQKIFLNSNAPDERGDLNKEKIRGIINQIVYGDECDVSPIIEKLEGVEIERGGRNEEFSKSWAFKSLKLGNDLKAEAWEPYHASLDTKTEEPETHTLEL